MRRRRYLDRRERWPVQHGDRHHPAAERRHEVGGCYRESQAGADFQERDCRNIAVAWLARTGCTVPEIAAITGDSEQTVYAILHYLARHPSSPIPRWPR
jgi:hypothetical protein